MTAKDPSREKIRANTMLSTNGRESSTVLVSCARKAVTRLHYACTYVKVVCLCVVRPTLPILLLSEPGDVFSKKASGLRMMLMASPS